MNLKKIISAAAAALCLFSAVPAAVYGAGSLQAEEQLSDGTFYYELVNGSYTITSCNPEAVFEELPELRNGYAVTAIADKAFANCTYISKLTIPDTITEIGSSAFAGCTSLKEVELPSRLKVMSDGIFMGCTNLESIDIPDSVNTISSYAFYNCSKLAEVGLSGELSVIEPMAFAECSSIESFDVGDGKSYVFEDGILYNSGKTNICRASVKLTGDVYISDGVTSIDAGAFSVCAGIENIFLPSSLSHIGDDAFGYCVSLKSIDFSEGLTTISPVAFKNCASLETLDFPTTLREIGDGAFYNCTKLERVIIPEGTETIGEGAFVNCASLEKAAIPKSVTSVGNNAFGFELNDSGEYVLKDGFTLSVFTKSSGAKYAKENKISSSAVDKDLKSLAFLIVAVGLILAVMVFAVVLMAKSRKTASFSAKKAQKLAKEKEEEENYKKIIE